jgi:hypothetical protein
VRLAGWPPVASRSVRWSCAPRHEAVLAAAKGRGVVMARRISPKAIAKTRDAPPLQRLGKPAAQPREDAHRVLQQGLVGRMINIKC